MWNFRSYLPRYDYSVMTTEIFQGKKYEVFYGKIYARFQDVLYPRVLWVL